MSKNYSNNVITQIHKIRSRNGKQECNMEITNNREIRSGDLAMIEESVD